MAGTGNRKKLEYSLHTTYIALSCASMYAFFYLYNQKQISGLHMMREPEEKIRTYPHRENVIFSNCTSIMSCAMFHRGRLSNGDAYLRKRLHEWIAPASYHDASVRGLRNAQNIGDREISMLGEERSGKKTLWFKPARESVKNSLYKKNTRIY